MELLSFFRGLTVSNLGLKNLKKIKIFCKKFAFKDWEKCVKICISGSDLKNPQKIRCLILGLEAKKKVQQFVKGTEKITPNF